MFTVDVLSLACILYLLHMSKSIMTTCVTNWEKNGICTCEYVHSCRSPILKKSKALHYLHRLVQPFISMIYPTTSHLPLYTNTYMCACSSTHITQINKQSPSNYVSRQHQSGISFNHKQALILPNNELIYLIQMWSPICSSTSTTQFKKKRNLPL